MNPPHEAAWREQLERLRDRLEMTERRHAAEIEGLRAAVSMLEERISSVCEPPEQEAAALPPPLPARVVMPEVMAEAPPPMIVPVPDAPEPAGPVTAGLRELDFGKVWFVRIGVVVFLTGLVFLGNYAYQNWVRDLPNGARLAALSACALAMMETGRRITKRESLRKPGEVLLAGGMAFSYYCAFAAHHVERLKVIDSPVLAAAFLTVAALAIAAVSWLRQTRTTAALGFILASYATMLQPIGWLSCFSNLLMAGTGLCFMLRRGWATPGVVSMLGTYAAFTGWQVLGAAHGRAEGEAVLWYLPPAWAMFALPGVLDRFRESLGERGRAWFTGANNVLFFLLFSLLWLDRHGADGYWRVAGIFGLVLLALGMAGRRANATAGGVNVCHGLLLLSLALVLKLEGHHLALGLAVESLVLAAAFAKFHGRSEAVFSLLAGLAAGLMILMSPLHAGLFGATGGPPLWSVALAAVLVAAAAVVMRAGCDGCRADFRISARQGVGVLAFTSALALSGGCLNRLAEPWPMVSNMAMATLLPLVSLGSDRRRALPEALWAALWFAANAFAMLPENNPVWGHFAAAGLSIAACAIWHRQPPAETTGRIGPDPAKQPGLGAWLHAAFVFPALLLMAGRLNMAEPWRMLLMITMSIVLVPPAVALRCGRLAPVAGLVALAALTFPLATEWPQGMAWPLFAATPAVWLAMLVMFHPGALARMESGPRQWAAGIFRTAAFLAWCQAWWLAMPESWFDWLALTTIAMAVAAMAMDRKLPPEAWCLLGLATCALGGLTASSEWRQIGNPDSWRGLGVVAGVLLLVFTSRRRRALIDDPELRAGVLRLLAFLGCGMTSLWATQMMVWRFGWKPAAVLWTVLGFITVSAGLWQRLKPFRLWGFGLLALALGKVFVSDVWDFNAFMRVVSFTVLGAALILLGLFYNHFAPVLRRMLEEEDGN